MEIILIDQSNLDSNFYITWWASKLCCRYVSQSKDITTYYILGSHDETHYKNGGATVNEWVSRCRDDMIYLGQDTAVTNINGIKFVMDHPGGGSSQSLSYKPQKRIEILESGHKPKVL